MYTPLAMFARLFAVVVALAAATAVYAEKPPNIILIMSDDIGYSDLGSYGGEVRTPHLDRLAYDGRRFTQFYNTARCCPSRASLMTGQYPHAAGIGHLIHKTPYPGYGDFLTSDTVTIAEVLKTAGYSNYMVGKWHVAPRSYDPVKDIEHWPTRRGFDKFYGTIAGSGSFYDPSTLTRDETYISPENDPEYKPESYYYTDAITDNALMYLDDHDSAKPFFLYVAYTAAHWPLHAPEDAIEEYRGKYDAGYEAIHAERLERMKGMKILPDVAGTAAPVGAWADVADKEVETSLMEVYAAMITRMDEGIGRIVEHLRETDQLDNTLIVYLQDNGACAEDPFGRATPERPNIEPMAPDEIQTSPQPAYTRDGRPVHKGHHIKAGPDDTYVAYKENWANVSNTPFRWYKHYVHEGGISTPMIAHWPARVPAREFTENFIRTPAHLIDIMATFIDIAGAEYPGQRKGVDTRPLPGVSLVPTLTTDAAPERPAPLFWEHEGNRAIRDGKWKLVALSDQPWELYDMESDRAEMNNLADEHPELVKKMGEAWYAWAGENNVLPLGAWKTRRPKGDELSGDVSGITLSQGDAHDREDSPYLLNRGLKITARVEEGPIEGLIVAQGASGDGYALYAEDDKIHFVVRRTSHLHHVATAASLPDVPFTIDVDYTTRGIVSLSVDGGSPVTADFYGPLLLHPTHGITAGTSTQNPVGDYPKDFSFQGKLGPIEIQTIAPEK